MIRIKRENSVGYGGRSVHGVKLPSFTQTKRVCFSDSVTAELKNTHLLLDGAQQPLTGLCLWNNSPEKQHTLANSPPLNSFHILSRTQVQWGKKKYLSSWFFFLSAAHLPWLLPWMLSPVCRRLPSHQLSAARTLSCGSRLHLPLTHAS